MKGSSTRSPGFEKPSTIRLTKSKGNCGMGSPLGRCAILSGGYFRDLPDIRWILADGIAAELPVLLLVRIFNVRITDDIEIESVLLRVFHVPEELLVPGGQRLSSGDPRTVVPNDFLDQLERRPIPQQVRQRNGLGSSWNRYVSNIEPERPIASSDPEDLGHPIPAPCQVVLHWQGILILLADVVGGAGHGQGNEFPGHGTESRAGNPRSRWRIHRRRRMDCLAIFWTRSIDGSSCLMMLLIVFIRLKVNSCRFRLAPYPGETPAATRLRGAWLRRSLNTPAAPA